MAESVHAAHRKDPKGDSLTGGLDTLRCGRSTDVVFVPAWLRVPILSGVFSRYELRGPRLAKAYLRDIKAVRRFQFPPGSSA